MSRPDVTTSTACPCIGEPLHRRTISADVEVVWTDVEGCDCAPGANLPMGIDTDDAENAAFWLTKAVALMRRIEATAPGSAQRAAIHAEGCESHECAEVAR